MGDEYAPSSSQHVVPELSPSDTQSSHPSLQVVPPQISVTGDRTDQITGHDRNHESEGSRLRPPGGHSRSPSSSRDPRQLVSRASQRLTRLFRRSPSPYSEPQNVSPPEESSLATTTRSSPHISKLSLSQPSSPDNSHSAHPTRTNYGPSLAVRTKLKRADVAINLPSSGSLAATVPVSDGTKTVISATKFMLQNASSALKISPIPYASQITDLLLTLLQAYETFDSNNESLEGFIDDIRKAYTIILRPLELYSGQIPRELIAPLKELHSALQKQTDRIKSLKSRGSVMRFVTGTNIAKIIIDVKEGLNKAIVSFSAEATTLNLLQTIQSSIQSELSRLKPAPAEHIHVKSKSKCLPTTQTKTRKLILDHLEDAKNRFVWLRGSPGTGKTAIAMSVASTLKMQGTLAASFFWDKNQTGLGLDSTKQFPSTLAHQLARFNEDFKMSLVRCLRQPDLEFVQDLPLDKQMESLVLEPMYNLTVVLPGRPVIVLDGLDECGDLEALKHLMELVLILEGLPATFAVFVSCRPESVVMSAWAEARERGLVIPCEDLDTNMEEKYHTIHCMVEDGLRDCIKKSQWKPSKEDLHAFTLACHGLPVMASIRIRDVMWWTEHGRTLQREFQDLLNLVEAPMDLNSEYLRILRRAYMRGSSAVPLDIAKMYHLLVGTIIAARTPLSVYSMSQLLGIPMDEAQATLQPISSIIELPLEDMGVKFYHATAQEFITGNPIGDENDKIFFINDKKGYFLGPLLLQILNNCCKENIPTDPLSDKKKWVDFKLKWEQPKHIQYVIENIRFHLDPAKLFSQESNNNELQNKFNSFLTQNLLTYLHMGGDLQGFDEFNDHDVVGLQQESAAICWGIHQWLLHRSMSLLFPPKSSLYKLYGHLSEPVQSFSISGEISNHLIPLSKALLNTQNLMEAKLDGLPKDNKQGSGVINYEAEFQELDVRNGIVTCAALSRDGRYVALGLGSGVIEIADIDDQCTISQFQNHPPNPPAWIEFIHDGHCIATEDVDGNISIYGHGVPPLKLGTLPTGAYPAVTAVSASGFFIVRVLRDPGKPWYNNMTCLHILGDLHIQSLASPSNSSFPSSQSNSKLAFPERHTIAFSPGAQYIAAFDGHSAFTWSTESCEFIAHYDVQGDDSWIINPGMAPTCPYDIPQPVSTCPTLPLAGETVYAHHSWVDAGLDSDKSWIKHPFFHHLPHQERGYSFAAGRAPLVHDSHSWLRVWFNGGPQLAVPDRYRPVSVKANSAHGIEPWYGDRVINHINHFYHPQSSKDGTRFLLQGKMKAPIVVDMGQAAWYPSTVLDYDFSA